MVYILGILRVYLFIQGNKSKCLCNSRTALISIQYILYKFVKTSLLQLESRICHEFFRGLQKISLNLFEISLCPNSTILLYFEYLSGGVLSSSGMHVKSSGFLFRESRPGSTLTGRKFSVCSEFLSTTNIVKWEIRIHFNL